MSDVMSTPTPDEWEALPHVVGEQGRELLDAAEWTHETFRGPRLTLHLSAAPDPFSLTVEGPDGNPAVVDVDGNTIHRVPGHFGRGRWTATYLPA